MMISWSDAKIILWLSKVFCKHCYQTFGHVLFFRGEQIATLIDQHANVVREAKLFRTSRWDISSRRYSLAHPRHWLTCGHLGVLKKFLKLRAHVHHLHRKGITSWIHHNSGYHQVTFTQLMNICFRNLRNDHLTHSMDDDGFGCCDPKNLWESCLQ